MRICFFGDSITNGVGDPDYQGWPGRLAAAANHPDLNIHNLGVRRQTSAEIALRWRAEAEARLPVGQDGRLVFSFGVVDCLLENGRVKMEQSDSLATARHVLSEALAWKPTLFIGPTPVADVATNERIRSLSGALAGLCRELNVPCLEVFGRLLATPEWIEAVRSGDGAHPGAEGYAALAGMIAPWRAWQDWL